MSTYGGTAFKPVNDADREHKGLKSKSIMKSKRETDNDWKPVDEVDDMRSEPRKIYELLIKQPELSKYDYKIDSKAKNPYDNIIKLLSSPIFGGSVLTKRVDGRRNSLKKQLISSFADTGSAK